MIPVLPAPLARTYYRLLLPFRRASLRNRAVSIISNDCWSSFMYQFYNIPFNSPFVGLFIMPDHYINILSDLSVLYQPMQITRSEESIYRNSLSELKPYPLGILPGGIEIHFLHYNDTNEAVDKWKRRLDRLDIDNCIVKFAQNNGCTLRHLQQFDALQYPSKVAFTTLPHPELSSVIPLPQFARQPQLGRYWKIADLYYNFARHANELLE